MISCSCFNRALSAAGHGARRGRPPGSTAVSLHPPIVSAPRRLPQWLIVLYLGSMPRCTIETCCLRAKASRSYALSLPNTHKSPGASGCGSEGGQARGCEARRSCHAVYFIDRFRSSETIGYLQIHDILRAHFFHSILACGRHVIVPRFAYPSSTFLSKTTASSALMAPWSRSQIAW
jgi:hypothetical protein